MSLQARDHKVIWHPFTQAATAPVPLPVVAAKGSWLELADGKRVFDAISSWWTCLSGHSHPAIVAAIADQAARLDHVLFAGCTHPGAVELAERLLEIAPTGMSRVFYSDDGSTAVEVALKLAIQYHAQNGHPGRQRFLALAGGYHGDTIGAMSVGDPVDFSGPFSPLLWPVGRLPVPLVHGDALAGNVDCTAELAELDRTLDRHGDSLAAVIVEPLLQGAGGMRTYAPEFLRQLAKKARERGILLIADEVMTGFGRTGAMFACQHAEITPDLLCIAKGLTGGTLPLAATMAPEWIYERFLGDSARQAFLHGHSFTANPIACAAALANLRVMRDEGLLNKAQALHQWYAQSLPSLLDHPQVHRVRWLGSIGVVELHGHGYHDAAQSTRLQRRCLDRGVLIRPLGPVLYTLPPLTADVGELQEVWRVISESLP